MSAYLEAIESHPDRTYLELDDATVKAFMVEMGLENQLSNSLPEVSYQDGPDRYLIYAGLKTHFMLIAKFTGYDSAKNNGYALFLFPKSQNSREEFLDQVKRIVERASGRIIASRTCKISPTPNRGN